MEDAPRPLHRLSWGGIGAYAVKRAWVEYNRTNGTLTFQYGEKTTLSAGYISEYWLNGVSTNPDWASQNSNVTKVVFDPSFASALPTSCFAWFRDCQRLETIIGIEYLNTSNVKNMAYMFYNCSSLTSLDVSNFNTSKVTNMTFMFASATSLRQIYFSEGFKVDGLDNLESCPAILYCSPKQYESFKSVAASSGNTVKPYVSVNPNMEYGTLCVPVGSSLAEGSFTGFDKLY